MTTRQTSTVALVCGFLLSATFLSQPALAQMADRVPRLAAFLGTAPLGYGTKDLTIYQVSASGCTALEDFTLLYEPNGYRRAFFSGAERATVGCSVNLPSGALIERFEVLAHDPDDTGNIFASLVVCSSIDIGTACAEFGRTNTTGTSTSPFTGFLMSDISDSDLLVDKANNEYTVRLEVERLTHQFRQVNVYYRLEVSAAPGSPTFGDVHPSHSFYRFIEALAASGITAGCGNGNFCPNRPVTRGEMAVFLAKALGLHFSN